LCYNQDTTNIFNFMLGRIIIGILICAFGFLIVKKSDWALDIFGGSSFGEKVFTGGSRSFYKMLGVILILVGFLVITNLHYTFLEGLGDFLFG